MQERKKVSAHAGSEKRVSKHTKGAGFAPGGTSIGIASTTAGVGAVESRS